MCRIYYYDKILVGRFIYNGIKFKYMNKKIIFLILTFVLILGFFIIGARAEENVTVSDVIVSNITTESIDISWTSSAEGDSQIRYYTDQKKAKNAKWLMVEAHKAGKTSHSFTLTGLNAGMTYYFKVRTTNSEIGDAISTQGVFTTSGGEEKRPDLTITDASFSVPEESITQGEFTGTLNISLANNGDALTDVDDGIRIHASSTKADGTLVSWSNNDNSKYINNLAVGESTSTELTLDKVMFDTSEITIDVWVDNAESPGNGFINESNEDNNSFTKTVTISSGITCTDSDDGKDYNNKGETCLGDDCLTDSCQNSSINEYYCQDNERKMETVECENSCEDGACKEESIVVCTQEYQPVCGQDGRTYKNRCVAEQRNNIQVAYEGECITIESDRFILKLERSISELEQQVIELEKNLIETVDIALVNRVKGRILLQVEEHGEAWYVDPISENKLYMKDGQAAYDIMRALGLGITNTDLEKIPIGIQEKLFNLEDTDGDGISDNAEKAIGTDLNKADSDEDGTNDKTEILDGYKPDGSKYVYDTSLTNRLIGRIVLQVESHGEAWYIHPENGKRYYLGDPDTAYSVMRYLSLGITNTDLRKIQVGEFEQN